MEVPQVTVKQEELNSFALATESDENYELLPHCDDIKAEPHFDVSKYGHQEYELDLPEKVRIIEGNDSEMLDSLLNQPSPKQESLPINSEGMSEIKMLETLVDVTMTVENEQLSVNDNEVASRWSSASSSAKIGDNAAGKKKTPTRGGDKFRCDRCAYATDQQRLLKSHLRRHKTPGEPLRFACEYCDYSTNYRNCLKLHTAKHANPDAWIACDQCGFEAPHKRALQKHYRTHTPDEIINMLKCDQCSYQSGSRFYYERHVMEIHRNPKKTVQLTCDQCDFKSVYQASLNLHMLKHRNPDELDVFKCNTCSYQTVHKKYLKRHLATHKNIDEATLYKCEKCDYQTLYKPSLKQHLLKHKDRAEMPVFKCDQCAYQTRVKRYLKLHQLKHDKNATVFKCYHCNFKTNQKKYINRHLVKHRASAGDVKKFVCNLCDFKCIFESKLKLHFLKHDGEKASKFKCEKCDFETVFTFYMERHAFEHDESDDAGVSKPVQL